MVKSAPLALMLFLNVLYFRVDTFLLALYKSNIDVGAYGFSYKIFEFLIAFPTFLSASIFPILITHKNDNLKFNKKVKSYSVLLLVSAIVLSVIVFLFAPIITVIKPDLTQAVLPLRILSFSLPFFFLTSLFQWVILLRNKVKILIGIYAITMLLNIFLNVLYVPTYSYVAASIITVITEGIVFVLMLLVVTFTKAKNYGDQ